MTAAHSSFDHLLFAILLVLPIVEWRWTWPRLLKRLASGAPKVRARFYRSVILGQWLITLCLLAFWGWRGRPWPWLLLGPSTPLRLGGGLAAAVVVAGLLWWQKVAILKRDDAIARVRRQLESAAPILPHTCAENRMFRVVSVTAGVCEEVLFRGFLLWYLAVWTGPVAAVILSSLLFGLGHVYLGMVHVPKTTLAGLFMACLALASGSLWPAIVIHAAMDWNSGEIGYRILSSSELRNG